MTRNPNLVPTAIVDSRGRQTTVHKKPLDASVSSAKSIPAPAPVQTSDWARADAENRVSSLFSPERYVAFVSRKLGSLSDESLSIVEQCAKKMGKEKFSQITDLARVVADIDEGLIGEQILPYLLRAIDHKTLEFSFVDMKKLYLVSMEGNSEPSSDEVLDAHTFVASKYFDTVLETESNDVPFKYLDNKVLFNMVSRHPEKAELILKHRHIYKPEVNGPEAFEADFDKLEELSKPISEGWL